MNKALYHKVKFFQITMMKKRGYEIPEKEKRLIKSSINESLSIFDHYYVKEAQDRKVSIETLLDQVYTKKKSTGDNTNNSISVIYVETDFNERQVKKATFDILASRILNNTENRNVLFISRVKWTPEGYKQFASYPIFNIEYMLYRELIYDPTAHFFQPQTIRILSNDERTSLIKKLGKQKVDVLHRLAADDPVVKWLGARPGQILLIVRKTDHISGSDETRYYRIVDNILLFEDKNKKPKEKKIV